ncbi:ABC transporter permease [Thalassobacillus devorans]|uniref:ABC transporter permease n=1 Tax=Thalassobacillus devorans TaxID=279813 RepID=A0ABQ1NRR7_9BACI|nr:TRAP transporter small permease [Thalassobacillus devorans]NIK28747.1 TRAP-type C4-dicarboxylate transport system permease small subunit [Thalassobacillus devorans]GGC83859.1 ABC transporter permease [Thalassobacillus devorans]
MLKKLVSAVNNLLNIAIAFSLAAMSLLVFGNVVLRYLFNSGITWSEEMSRYFFVWLVFLGAIAALKDRMHLGVDIVVNLLPEKVKKVVFVLSNGLVLYLLWLLLEGSWRMTILNANSTGPATGMPLSYLYGIGVVTSIAMMILILINIIKAFSGAKDSYKIVQTTEEAVETEEETLVANAGINEQTKVPVRGG